MYNLLIYINIYMLSKKLKIYKKNPKIYQTVLTSDVNDAELLMPSRDFHFREKLSPCRSNTLVKRAETLVK